MIEGNLKDVSLPGLLQFLGAEVSKNFRISMASAGQTGEVYVCKGFVVCAAFGLLEGEDAMCEFLAWRDGTFFVEQLTPQVEVRKNLKRVIPPSSSFAENGAYLSQNNVGLNTVLTASESFRGSKWQELIKQQPLEREDFVVVGWLGEGRTMRQAVREFNFDIAQATAILSRLIKTNSVDPHRTVTDDAPPELLQELEPILERYTTGGHESDAANLAQAAARAYTPDAGFVQDAFISTSFRPQVTTEPDPVSEQKSSSRNPFLDPFKKIGIDLAQARASVEARLRVRTVKRMPGDPENPRQSRTNLPPAAPQNPFPSATPAANPRATGSNMTPAMNLNARATNSNMPAANPRSTNSNMPPANPRRTNSSMPAVTPKRTYSNLPPAPLPDGGSFGPGASGSNWAPVGAPNNLINPAAGTAGTTSGTNNTVAGFGQITSDDIASLANPTTQSGEQSALDTSDLLSPIRSSPFAPSTPIPLQSGTQHPQIPKVEQPRQSIPDPVKAFTSGTYPSIPNTIQAASEALHRQDLDSARGATSAPPTVSEQNAHKKTDQPTSGFPNVMSAAAKPEQKASTSGRFEGIARTEALPMVTIDIERLLSATFSPTQFGKLALKNPALDQFRRQTLLDVEAGRTLASIIDDGGRPPAAVLNSYRYCLDRGYVETNDSVVPLTVDLLLGRMEIDQYLLQRRRLTGDQLRDLIDIARKEGVKLIFVLVRGGFLTKGDLDTLEREQERFALK